VNQKLQYVVDQYKKRRRLLLGAGITAVGIIVFLVIGAVFQPLEVFFQMPTHRNNSQPVNQPNSQSPSQNQEQDYFADVASLPSCGDKRNLFALSPLQLSDFTLITPLGLLSPTSHVFPSPHLYFNVRRINPANYNSLPVEVPVVAPADLRLTTIKFIEAKGKPDYNDGMVAFGICKEFKAYFDHLKTFAPKIKEAFDKAPLKRCDEYSLTYPQPTGKIDFKLCEKTVDVEIKNGEQIGTAGGGQGQLVLDFGSFDKRITPKQFANPKKWLGREHLVYISCSLDYYQEPLKGQLKERLGGFGQKGEIKGTDCGEVIQDVPGAAQGAWAPPGTEAFSHEPPYLALVHDYIEPQYLVFSMGDSAEKAGLPHGKYTFLPKNDGLVNRHFKDIKSDGKVYCFETEDLYQANQRIPVTILLNLPAPEKLRIQKLNATTCGSGPWTLTNFVEFER
jgi:hypothetical protein